MRKNLLAVAVIISFSFSLQAQMGTTISLDSLYKEVEANNYDIRISEKNYQSAQADFRKSNANFLPQLTIAHTGIKTTNPLMAFGSKLNQEILESTDFNPGLLNDPDPIQNFSTQLSLLQPVFNADGLQQRKALKMQMESKQLQNQRTKDYMKLEVTKAYMQLQLVHAQLNVLKNAETTALENQKVAQSYFDQGILQRSELLRVNIHLTSIENQINQVQIMIQNLSDVLNFYRGKEAGETLIPKNVLQKYERMNSFSMDLSDSRADIQAMEKGKLSAEHMYKASKMGYLPRLNAFASYDMHDSKLGNTNAKGYLIGAELSWNLFDGFKRIASIQKSKIDLDKANLNLEKYKLQSQMELSRSKRILVEKRQAIVLHELSVEQAKEALRITSNRFDQGLEKTSELLKDETLLLQKELALIQAFFDYNYTYSQLEYLTQ